MSQRAIRTLPAVPVLIAMFLLSWSLLPATLVADEPAASLAGKWLGTLEVGPSKLRLLFQLSEADDHKLRGTLTSLDQGKLAFKLDAVELRDGNLHVSVKSIAGSFTGKLSEGEEGKPQPSNEQEIVGKWEQGGVKFPLVLKRVDEIPPTLRPQEPKPPFPYEALEVTFGDGGADDALGRDQKDRVTLAGTLTLPKVEGRLPAVVLISGSGPQDRDETLFEHKPFWILADHLSRQGIAVLRYDDRGVGKSTGKFGPATTEDFTDDALAAVAFLKQHPRIDPKRIGLIGHSEGGLVAPLAATRSPDVALAVLLAGPGVTGEEILYLQSRRIFEASGVPAEFVEANHRAQQTIFAAMKNGEDAAIDKAVRELVQQQLALSKPADKSDTDKPDGAGNDEESGSASKPDADDLESQVKAYKAQMTTPWFKFFLTYDPAPTLAKVKCPVLAIFGEKDLQVIPSQNLEIVQQSLKQGVCQDFTVEELPGLNHLFQRCQTGLIAEYGQIEETMSSTALNTIADWLVARFKPVKP